MIYSKFKDIVDWLERYQIKNYSLHPHSEYGYVVDVKGDVGLYNIDEEGAAYYEQLSEIPIKFRHVSGSFWCYNNALTSLEFCPEIIEKEFDCSNNNISSLEFCPKYAKRFICYLNPRLGHLQDERDFFKILSAHYQIQDSLEQKKKLERDLVEQNTVSAKVKL